MKQAYLGSRWRSRISIRWMTGFLVFLSCCWSICALAQDGAQGLRFPFGVLPFIVDNGRDSSDESTPPSGAGRHEDHFGRRVVIGPSNQTWRITPSLSGAWITAPNGEMYRLSRGLVSDRIYGPRGEVWQITPGLSGSARIQGPGGAIYHYVPSIVGGGRIYGPKGQSWTVMPSLGGTLRVY